MTDLIQRIVAAIIRQEGMSPTYTNPGNLRAAPWFSFRPSLGTLYQVYADGTKVEFSNRFWSPRTRQEGIAGAAHVVALHVAEGNSLRQLISIWAPPSDHNNTEAYMANVANWAQIPDVDAPLWTWI